MVFWPGLFTRVAGEALTYRGRKVRAHEVDHPHGAEPRDAAEPDEGGNGKKRPKQVWLVVQGRNGDDVGR